MAMDLIPHLVVDDGAAAVDFYKAAFGATEVKRMPFKDGRRLLHAELSFDGKRLMLCDDFPEMTGGKGRSPKALGGSTTSLNLTVPDCDAACAAAVKAGATVDMPPGDMFWGDRFAKLTDPFGHEWTVSSPLPPDRAKAAAADAKNWT